MHKKINHLGLAAALAAVLSPAAMAAEGVRSLTTNAVDAVAALEIGLKPSGSLEAAHASGWKAEQALQGLSIKGRAPAAVKVLGTGSARVAEGKDAVTAPAPTAPQPNLGARIKDGAIGKVIAVREGYSKLSKLKRVGVLAGLLALEAGAMFFPVQAITIAFVAMGAFGIFGTTREIINLIRRK